MEKIKYNEMVQIFRGTHPRCFWNTTLSKKGRAVKIVELKDNCRPHLMRFSVV